MRDVESTIGGLIDKQRIAYLSSVDEAGYPNTKAMLAPREREGIKVLYFTTNTSSRRVAQFRENPKACAYFADTRFFRGVMLLGEVEVLADADSKERVWRDGDDLYYPLGVTDPDYCVLRFTAFSGRYYSHFHSEDFPL